MPPSVVTSATVNSYHTSDVNFVASRTRRQSASIDTVTPRITTRKAQRTLIGNNVANGCSVVDDPRRRLIDCSVVLVDICANGSLLKRNLEQLKDSIKITKIPRVPTKGTTLKPDTRTESPKENNIAPSERSSYVTRRTRTRQTKSIGQTHDSSGSEDHQSIIHLDESSNVGRKSITDTVDLSHKHTTSGNDVLAVRTSERRITRRISVKSADCNQKTINARTAQKRKTNNVLPAHETGVSPPKQALNAQQSVLEHSVEPIGQKDTIPVATVTESPKHTLDKLNNEAFKTLIVSIKRIAPALTVDELNRLKYEDSARDSRFLLRPSSSRANWRQKSSIKVERATLVKPKLIITSPIIEVPESPPQTVVNHSYLTVPEKASTAKSDLFKRPNALKHQQMPLLLEDENEENEDVYAFPSSSQNSDTSSTTKTKRQQPKQPKQKRVTKASGAKATNSNKRNVSKAKPKVKSVKGANLFGCNTKALNSVIKRLGGGPVQQPATLDYKINLDIPKTPPVVASPVNVPRQVHDVGLPVDDHHAPLETTRTLDPELNRLKASSLSFPLTSTPTNRMSTAANKLSMPSVEKHASPWRLQNDLIVPRTSYTHRSKEMLPSYESFAIKNTDPPRASGYITERRKSPSGATSIEPLPLAVPEPGEGVITDKELREMERIYVELKATSEMSEKLIRAMRLSKQKAATPQQDQTMRQACLKLKKWYDRSMNAFGRSMRILGNVQRTPGCGFTPYDRPTTACPSPLSHEQQVMLNDFNSSTDRFRSMLAQLQSTINDSDIENVAPPMAASEDGSAALGKAIPANKKVTVLQDILILPDRSDAAKRNPLMPLNVVPLPQRESPLMSPLAKTQTNPGPKDASGPNHTRRELQYDKENEIATTIPDSENQQKDTDNVAPIVASTPQLHVPSAHSVVEINETTMHDGSGHSDKHLPTTERTQNSRDYFGFDEDVNSSSSAVETSLPQVTLPMPLNISHKTLERRLKNVKQLLPKRPIFRAQPTQQNQLRSSGPTRFPRAPRLRVIGSPTKWPQTLRDFVASTPRAAGSSKEQAMVPSIEAPNVSAIAVEQEQQPVGKQTNERNDESHAVALFDTPDRPAWLNNSAHQRTYTRIPKRRKKRNIYLANLGLDDESDEDEENNNDESEELSSDSETDRKKKGKKKKKASRKKPVPVEETNNFKQFVESFNSMCEQVERYELIVE